MSMADQGRAEPKFDDKIRPGATRLKLDEVRRCVGSRAGYFLSITMGTLKRVRFRVQTTPFHDPKAPNTDPGHQGQRWFDVVLPNGLPYWDAPTSGRFYLPFTATGADFVALHIEVEGAEAAEGALNVCFGKQTGGN